MENSSAVIFRIKKEVVDDDIYAIGSSSCVLMSKIYYDFAC